MKRLALILPLLALAVAGCGKRSPYAEVSVEREITNADYSETVEIRVSESREPLYYSTVWVFCTEESYAHYHRERNGAHYESGVRRPYEGQWFITVARVPELFKHPLLPLDFDEKGKCLHPPAGGIPAISVSRKDDGTIKFTLGPEAQTHYPGRPLVIFINGEQKFSTQLQIDNATNGVSAASSPAPGEGSGEAEPSPSVVPSDPATNASETHAENAESAEN